MIEAVLVVVTNAADGRDDAFNDWYTNIHLRDALRFRGSIAAQRFSWSARQVQEFPGGYHGKYLALYEVFDPKRFSREHFDNALTTRMQVTTAIAMEGLNDFHYYPLLFRDNNPGTVHEGGVVMEQIKVKDGQQDAFVRWYDGYFAAASARPGVRKATLMLYRPYGQLIDKMPAHDMVAVYWLDDDQALDAWQADGTLRQSDLIDQQALAVTCWNRLTPRITEDQVHHTSAAALAAEERARERMGDDILRLQEHELNAT